MPDVIAATMAVVCASAAEVALRSDVVFFIVPDTPDVEGVLFSDAGVSTRLKAGEMGKIVVDISSISPKATKAFASRIGALGADDVASRELGSRPLR